jgi:glycosyltransferase involved in cell wall biosynthesis
MLAARLTRTPCVTHERGINDRYPPLSRFFGRGLDAIICISEAVRTNMRERGADFGNLVTILNGLDPDAMRFEVPPEQIRARYGIQPDAAVIVMLGNIKAWKGQETLVRAIARVRDVYPSVKCLLVGGTSPSEREYETTLRALVSTLGVQDQIVFTGFQQNVGDFIRASDVVAHASIEPEPFGRVILEAMACRKPVIGSRAGAIPEIVVEGETGVTFPPGDDDALARAIVGVIGDRARARQMGDNGFERLSREFHIRQNVESTVRLYDRLLSAAH